MSVSVTRRAFLCKQTARCSVRCFVRYALTSARLDVAADALLKAIEYLNPGAGNTDKGERPPTQEIT